MTTSAPVNIPANSTAARVLEALEKYRLKREPSGQYRADCPWQKDSDSHSLRIKIKDGEHGTWRYFAGDGDGSLYELAEKLGIEYPRTPTVKSGKGVTLDVGTSKRTYSNIADYAIQHGLTPDELSAAGIREGRHYCIDLRKSRPALLIETPTGERVRYLDGNKPEYRSPTGYTKCWYRLEIALGLCKATERPLVICNGEISTLAAQLRGIAATALAGGSEQGIPDPLIADLKAKYDGEVLIAFDSDTTGRDGARKVARQLREAGMTVQIVDLNGPKGWDLADFVQQPGNDKPEALRALIVTDSPDDEPVALPPFSSRPALPASAQLPEDLGRNACPWLDAYIAFSRQWSPRSFDGFHEGCALWLLSTIAARRLVTHLGGLRYPNLYIALCARTSLWAKSTAAKIATDTISQAGLSYLLAPDDSTPQAFIASMNQRVPANFDDMPGERRQFTEKRLAFAAQRGWYYEEFGQKISAMMRENGAMADYRGLLRRLDDCPERYESATIGRGTDELIRPYLALLASLTPADMAPFSKKNGALWSDGFFARFGFITPPIDTEPPTGEFPRGTRIIPPSIVMGLQHWHQWLGEPHVSIMETKDESGKYTGEYELIASTEPQPQELALGNGVYEAFYRYHNALILLTHRNDSQDLDGNYARLAEKALRIAMLLASVSGSTTIEMCHWARAQEIAERWRRNLHALIDQLQGSETQSREAELEDKVMRALEHVETATIRDLRAAHLRSYSSEELERVLDSLERLGRVTSEPTRTKSKRYRPVQTKRVTVESVKCVNDVFSYTVQPQQSDVMKCVAKNEDLHSYTVTQLHSSDQPDRNSRSVPPFHSARREIMAALDAGRWDDATELLDKYASMSDWKPERELLAQARRQQRSPKPDPMAEHNRDMQLIQEIKQLERVHDYDAARALVSELAASQEAKQELIESITREEARHHGRTRQRRR